MISTDNQRFFFYFSCINLFVYLFSFLCTLSFVLLFDLHQSAIWLPFSEETRKNWIWNDTVSIVKSCYSITHTHIHTHTHTPVSYTHLTLPTSDGV